MARTITKKSARGGEKQGTTKRSAQKDAIMMLKEDHERVKQLLAKLESTTERAGDRRRKLLEDIERELRIHTKLEEEIFYPHHLDMAKKREDRAMYFEAKEEHRVVETLIPSLRDADPASEEFAGKAHLLKEMVEHHIKEEEKEMFAYHKRNMSKEELVMLGEQMQTRKRELLAMERAEREAVPPATGETLSSARVDSAASRRMEWGDEDSLGSDRAMDDEEGQRPI